MNEAGRALEELRVVTLGEFVADEKPGSAALIGTPDEAVIAEGSDAMIYGSGGVGKTTLVLDLAFHLAAGTDWLGISVERPVCVLIIENEGPRERFRRKLERKRDAWKGAPLEDRLLVFAEPWGRFSFAESDWRERLARTVQTRKVDLVIAGPITSAGMDAAGTLQEVREFLRLVDQTRVLSGRPIANLLVHHENRGGRVSGAWEAAGDTLLHAQQYKRGELRLEFEKARWSSDWHRRKLTLAWTEGEGFERIEEEPSRPERVWEDVATYVLEHGGCGWNEVDRAVSGQSDYLRRRRDLMLEDGLLINAGHGQRFELWHRDDPSRPTLELTASENGRSWAAVASAPGDEGLHRTASPRPPFKGDAVRDAVGSGSPAPLESANDDAVASGRKEPDR